MADGTGFSGGGFFRQSFTAVYLPTIIYEAGIGAAVPIIPLYALKLGASVPQAAFVVALLGIGQVIGDIPAGHLAARLGDRKAMLYGAGITIIGLLICALATHWTMLAAGVGILGFIGALFLLARQAYLTDVTPVDRRSRALSTLGGMHRVGALIGPFLGGVVMTLFANTFGQGEEWLTGAFWLAILLVLSTGIVVYLVDDVDVPGRIAPVRTSVVNIVKFNWRIFATIGIAFILVGALRQTRVTVIPLWSNHLGLSPSLASFVFGLSGLLDAALFYPGGRLMDLRGRLWVAIPSTLILGSALILLPTTYSFATLIFVALLMGLGNGIGSGILMTIGADLAPAQQRAQFLSLCRILSDVGTSLGPLVIAMGARGGYLSTGIVAMGISGFIAAAILGLLLPRFNPHANRHSRRRAGLTSRGHAID